MFFRDDYLVISQKIIPRTVVAVILFFSLISLPIINSLELKLVQVLCRHGDRAPIDGYQVWYPTDPYLNEKYEPAGLGELTEEGRNRSFTLGEFLRCRYFSQLKMSREYSRTIFRARSSDVQRCRKSAEAMLAGLFPGAESVPIFNHRLREDRLFVGTHICRLARAEMARADRSMGLFEDDQKWPLLREYLTQHLRLNATRYHAFILQDTLMAQRSFGLPLPSWTNKIYPSDNLEKNAAYEYVRQSYSNKLKRINGGLWIGEFLDNIDKVVSGEDAAKMLLYVGHDVNVAGFLSALEIFQLQVPNFGSFVSIELYQDPQSNEYHVRLFHKNYEKLEELKVPGCSQPCPLEDFKFLTKHLVTRNAKKECGSTA